VHDVWSWISNAIAGCCEEVVEIAGKQSQDVRDIKTLVIDAFNMVKIAYHTSQNRPPREKRS
jgi:hypothetical protein